MKKSFETFYTADRFTSEEKQDAVGSARQSLVEAPARREARAYRRTQDREVIAMPAGRHVEHAEANPAGECR